MLNTFEFRPMQCNNSGVRAAVCLSIHAAAGPSIHPTIYILARGPFALCQAILIPIYHPFLCRSFFSISLFFLSASFFFKPFDSNWFLSRPLIRMPVSSFLYSSSSSSSSLSASLCCFFFSFLLSFIPSYADTQMRICSPVLFRSVQRTFLFLATSGKGICERKTHDDVRKGSYRNIGWTKHLHALLHMRRECSRSDSVENRSLESPIIAILLFSTITPWTCTKKQSIFHPINFSFIMNLIKKSIHTYKIYTVHIILLALNKKWLINNVKIFCKCPCHA